MPKATPSLTRSGLGRGLADHVGPLDRSANPALGDHLQHAAADQAGDVPVQARGRNVGQLDAELRCGERPVALRPPFPSHREAFAAARGCRLTLITSTRESRHA